MEIPDSTYRLQFTPSFKFSDAEKIVPYLTEMGISAIYASPVFKARKGSQHGYDITDPNVINPELGSEDEFYSLLNRCKEYGLGWIQDIVPNHMAYDFDNHMLMDVLTHGQKSAFASFFDINWEAHQANFRNKIMAPFLGRPYGSCLQEREIKLVYTDKLVVEYYDHKFPVRPESYRFLLDTVKNIEPKNTRLLYSQLDELGKAADPEEYRQLTLRFYDQLQLISKENTLPDVIKKVVEEINQSARLSGKNNKLHEILKQQHYQLCYWRVSNTSNNYRRFFTINDLISLRNDFPSVFKYTHQLILKLVKEGYITGLRVDHIDGLYYPRRYLKMLREETNSCYLVVEKILETSESLPTDWPVEGTTGYDALIKINNLFINQNASTDFSHHFQSVHPDDQDPVERVSEKKRNMLVNNLNGHLSSLVKMFQKPVWDQIPGTDASVENIREAIVLFLSYLPVYRTYITPTKISENDRQLINETLARCHNKAPEIRHVITCLGNLFLQEDKQNLSESQREAMVHATMRLQQLSGPLMAKGVEDTLFYDYYPLLSMNEVGGNPFEYGTSTEAFHSYFIQRMKKHPLSMNASATHDTKRGEDVRARLNVLSEMPALFIEKYTSWQYLAFEEGTKNKYYVPEPLLLYALFQTILGTYPADHLPEPDYPGRIKDYMIKFVREGKRFSSWTDPNETCEKGIISFTDKVLEPRSPYMAAIKDLLSEILLPGVINSISQLILKTLLPGIPDFYQGTELTDLSLVDPDNRRPVDYEKRMKNLSEIKNAGTDPGQLVKWLNQPSGGMLKQYVIFRLLYLRKEYPDLFRKGKYIPVEISGKHSDQFIGFSREYYKDQLLIIVPICSKALADHNKEITGSQFDNTTIGLSQKKATVWKNVFTGTIKHLKVKASLEELFDHIPFGIWSANTTDQQNIDS